MRLSALALAVPFALTLLWASPLSAEPSTEVFSGTVEKMDTAEGKVTVKNDIGRDVALKLLNPELLKGVAIGDRVSVELEEPGKARKITKLTVPELKDPPDSGK